MRLAMTMAPTLSRTCSCCEQTVNSDPKAYRLDPMGRIVSRCCPSCATPCPTDDLVLSATEHFTTLNPEPLAPHPDLGLGQVKCPHCGGTHSNDSTVIYCGVGVRFDLQSEHPGFVFDEGFSVSNGVGKDDERTS